MHNGRAGSDIRNSVNKFRDAFRMINNSWKSSQYSTKTKLRLYQLRTSHPTILPRMLEDD